MSEFSSMNDVGSLSNLLNESRISQENNLSNYSQPPVNLAPSSVVYGRISTSHDLNNPHINKNNVITKDIWTAEEILTEETLVDWKDDRPAPRYEFSYKQTVGTEDTFLGMSDKTPHSSDCTHLVIKIHFPKTCLKELDLNITKNRIKAASKNHHLFTYLPVDVDADNGKAKFDSSREVLTITLPIQSNI